MINPLESCRHCRFFHLDQTIVSTGRGFCRRFPPNGRNGWPMVDPADFCGEFGRGSGPAEAQPQAALERAA